jgi:dihydroorotate dehydrogenase (fumarate)/dihydropyrimidine dehydrogenase (NAD+) subunit PreA
MADLSVEIAGVRLKNPFVLSSAEPTESFDKMKQAIDQGAGAVISKSYSTVQEMKNQSNIAKYVFLGYDRRPAWGKDIPKFFTAFSRTGMIQMPEDDWMEELAKTQKYAEKHDAVVIGSVAGHPTIEETVRLAKKMEKTGVKMIEIDLGCPQVEQMKEKGALLKTKEEYFERAEALTKALSIPLVIKLSPQQADLVATARGVRDRGAAAVTCLNRFLGFMPDPETAKPVIWTFGGVGGPWMLPIALRWVAKIHLDMPDLSIFGSNGPCDWEDMVRFHMSGATAVQFCTIIMAKGYGVIKPILEGLNNFLDRKGYKSVRDIIGVAARAAYDYSQLYTLPEYNEKSVIDPDLCIRCGKCSEVCWYDAIVTDSEGLASSIEAKCKGCYNCMAVCPVPKCITMRTVGKPIGFRTY